MTVFGTALDVTLDELAIEAFYPADAETAGALQERGRAGAPPAASALRRSAPPRAGAVRTDARRIIPRRAIPSPTGRAFGWRRIDEGARMQGRGGGQAF